MHFHFLDNYNHLDSPVHRLPSGVKMFFALSIVISAVVVPVKHYIFFAALGLGLLFVCAASLIPGAFFVKRVILLEPIVLGVGLLSLFQPNGKAIFLALIIRTTICIVTLTLLANTTPLNGMLRILRKMRVPAILITTIALMYRYLFVLMEESQRMRRARSSRTFTRSARGKWSALGSIVAMLFVRSSQRAERVYNAMVSRGWQ